MSPTIRNRLMSVLALLMVLVGVGYGGISWYLSNIIIYFSPRDFDADLINPNIRKPADYGLPEPEEVTIALPVGHLAAWLYHPSDEAGCAVLLQHGHGNHRMGVTKYVHLFRDRGCTVLTPDARYHGESFGEAGTYGYWEKYDLQSALAWLSERTKLPKRSIGLAGESMGGAIALQTAPLEPEVAFVFAESPYRNLRSIIEKRGVDLYGSPVLAFFPAALWLSSIRADFVPAEVAPEESAKKISVPVFLSHSRTDEYIPYAHSEAIFASVPHDRKALYITEWGAMHAHAIDDDESAYRANVHAFFDRFVPDFGRSPGANVMEENEAVVTQDAGDEAAAPP